MKKANKKIAALLAVSVLSCTVPAAVYGEESAAASREIVIDGENANTAENMLYRGAGMVSANNSSRLLIDYKAENPDAYRELMDYIFGSEGIGINHLKLEMGADVNSSSGTEPSVKRTEEEKADVTRGAGFQLAADAKAVNPDLTLDMLYWGLPKWVDEAEDKYAARYKWYKETLDAAYETYGLKFDYVSAVQNERAADTEWVKYLSEHLKNEDDAPYDYSQIKIVGGEGVCHWAFANDMLEDEALMNAVDVVGSHYTSWSTEEAQRLAYEYGKELWFSEASSPMSYSQGTYRYDGTGSGMSDINGLLDIANRIITMYPGGKMTLYEYQPAVSAYYDGVTYCHKQLISACDPWSGYYFLDGGFYMSLHFSQFIKKGWAFVDGACYGDGKAGGDGHAVVDAVYSYMTATDTTTGDYSTVITNTTPNPITYSFTVKNLEKASSAVGVWETRGPDGGEYNENYFKNIDTVNPTENNGAYCYSVTVKPYSMVTVSTVTPPRTEYENSDAEERTVLSLPYSDDYEYEGYPELYLSSRGGAPRYTTDEGGAFEVVNKDGNNVLMQKITPDIKGREWGGSPDPTTNFGDDRWYNYRVGADVFFSESENKSENYVGVGLRYCLADSAQSGYWIQLFEDGSWELNRNKRDVQSGKLSDFDSAAGHRLMIEAFNGTVRAYADGALLCTYETPSDVSVLGAGRAALYSSYSNNFFDNTEIAPVEGYDTYITRYDDTDGCFEYSGDWEHETMSSFKNLKRTVSNGGQNSTAVFNFTGNGFAITGGSNGEGVVSIEVDGETVEEAYTLLRTELRTIIYGMTGLEDKAHKVVITVKEGQFRLDGAEVTGGSIPLAVEEENTALELTEAPEETGETVTTHYSSSDNTALENMSAENSDSGEENGFNALPVVLAAAAAAVVITVILIVAKKKK